MAFIEYLLSSKMTERRLKTGYLKSCITRYHHAIENFKKSFLAIVEESFYVNQATILYIFETGDDKQRMCSK